MSKLGKSHFHLTDLAHHIRSVGDNCYWDWPDAESYELKVEFNDLLTRASDILAKVATRAVPLKVCPQCSESFAVGRKGDRKPNAVYCSTKCQRDWNYTQSRQKHDAWVLE